MNRRARPNPGLAETNGDLNLTFRENGMRPCLPVAAVASGLILLLAPEARGEPYQPLPSTPNTCARASVGSANLFVET